MNQTTAPNSFRRQRATLAALMSLLLLLPATGCRSLSKPGSASFASVTIQNRSPEEIAAATAKVFGEDGYSGGLSQTGQLVFQKEASRAKTLSNEGLFATQQGSKTANRVRAEIVPLAGGSYRLQCQAYVVRGAGDAFFEDEVRLTNVRSGPYQSLLNKVAKLLK